VFRVDAGRETSHPPGERRGAKLLLRGMRPVRSTPRGAMHMQQTRRTMHYGEWQHLHN